MGAMAGSGEEEEPVDGVNLEGLWQKLADDPVIRKLFVKSKTLFSWPTPGQTGVINYETLRPNSRLLSILIENWCPKMQKAKTVYQPHARAEAGRLCCFYCLAARHSVDMLLCPLIDRIVARSLLDAC